MFSSLQLSDFPGCVWMTTRLNDNAFEWACEHLGMRAIQKPISIYRIPDHFLARSHSWIFTCSFKHVVILSRAWLRGTRQIAMGLCQSFVSKGRRPSPPDRLSSLEMGSHLWDASEKFLTTWNAKTIDNILQALSTEFFLVHQNATVDHFG